MKEWYQKTKEEALQDLECTMEGLSLPQVTERIKKYGENTLKEGKKKSTLEVFLSQFADLLVVILIAAAIISAFSGNTESTVIIIAVIVMNAILGTVQHKKAEKSLDSLKSLSSPTAKVIRAGQKIQIASKEVLPGDILILEAGDLVVADGRILDNFSLQVNESSLTGESTNVDKNTEIITEEVPLADRMNMVYSGSLVTYGRAIVLVTETGMNTEIGKIASLMNQTKEKETPLQISLNQFSKRLAIAIMGICVVVFGLSFYRGMTLLDSMMFAVALAVAAIPEALSSIVTIVQAMGTQKMAKENAIIKELKAVESLGCVSVICSDKTGTLTQNKMTVQQIYVDDKVMEKEELELSNKLHRHLVYNAVLANDASIVDGKGIGDPTEFCLLEMAQKIGVDDYELRASIDRLEEIPFDSDRKMMTVKVNIGGKLTIFTKGAVDVMMGRMNSILTAEGVRAITVEDKIKILDQNQRFSESGLRVLAFAYKEVGEEETLSLESEHNLIFLGLISMMDPPRAESKDAVSDAKRAGIKPIMITGDHKVTATAIAKEIGIFEEGDLAVTGMELDAMSEEELEEKIEHISVYARVSPENKIRIVNCWQKKGHITAMTGDGVNDAPALKKADIGVAMGITGTEVSKDASSMILTDDNFATIIKAVANGRNVYRNIKNAIRFLLSGNMAGILGVLYTTIRNLPIPFAPVHLLFINLLTDSLPALAIGMEQAEKDLLSRKPRDPKESILSKDLMWAILWQGAFIAVCTMTAFHIGLNAGDDMLASTMAFATLTLARLFHGFNCRNEQSIFKIGFSSNWYSVAAFFGGVVFLAFVLFVPFLQGAFSVAPMTMGQIGAIVGLAVIPTVVIQIMKLFK